MPGRRTRCSGTDPPLLDLAPPRSLLSTSQAGATVSRRVEEAINEQPGRREWAQSELEGKELGLPRAEEGDDGRISSRMMATSRRCRGRTPSMVAGNDGDGAGSD